MMQANRLNQMNELNQMSELNKLNQIDELKKTYHFSNNREKNFQQFKVNALDGFWASITQDHYLNYRNQKLAYMYKSHKDNDKVIVLVNGRAESYLRYKEVFYDFYHAGYDVFCFDHLGQGFSNRLLKDEQKGHIDDFNHYVADLIKITSDFFDKKGYKYKFVVAHSMGAGILAHAILKAPTLFDAAVLCAPMLGINIPLPESVANNILNIAEKYQGVREYYAIGSGKWRALPFSLNRVTNSQVRYEYNIELLNSLPSVKVGGPTYHWVREAKKAAAQLILNAPSWNFPTLLMQAGKEILVCNKSQNAFIEACAVKPEFILYEQAKHELLMEKDEIRVDVLNNIFGFFEQHMTKR